MNPTSTDMTRTRSCPGGLQSTIHAPLGSCPDLCHCLRVYQYAPGRPEGPLSMSFHAHRARLKLMRVSGCSLNGPQNIIRTSKTFQKTLSGQVEQCLAASSCSCPRHIRERGNVFNASWTSSNRRRSSPGPGRHSTADLLPFWAKPARSCFINPGEGKHRKTAEAQQHNTDRPEVEGKVGLPTNEVDATRSEAAQSTYV